MRQISTISLFNCPYPKPFAQEKKHKDFSVFGGTIKFDGGRDDDEDKVEKPGDDKKLTSTPGPFRRRVSSSSGQKGVRPPGMSGTPRGV